MHDASTPESRHLAGLGGHGPAHDLAHQIEHAAHLLPSQGPITVFVHHNTLHAFEDLPFDEAVRRGAATYGCHPYLPEGSYRGEVARGRITPGDLAEALVDDLGEDADVLIGFMGTRYHLRLAMLEHPLRLGTDAELRWLVAETDALVRFRDEATPESRRRVVDRTRRWVLGDATGDGDGGAGRGAAVVAALLDRFGASTVERWPARIWESFTLHLLWRICHAGVHGVRRPGDAVPPPARHRDLVVLATGRDTDLMVHEVLIRFCAAFLDQGFATWPLPGREAGFFRAFAGLYRDARPVDPWLRGLPDELRRVERAGLSPIESIDESLRLLGVAEPERAGYLAETLLALRGWAGMLRQMETNAEWAAHPAPPGTLREYLAVRLLLERVALRHVAREALPGATDLRDLRAALRHRIPRPSRVSVDQRAYLVFQLAQVRGWGPADLHRLSKVEWGRLVEEIESFGDLDRRRIYHLAYERHYRDRVLDALTAHAGAAAVPEGRAIFQVVCCLDEREESFRRHLEEVEPGCETFGVAGYFGVAMYYRGVTEAHFRPLCPISVTPRHYVQEEPTHSFEGAGRIQAEARRRLGRLSHMLHLGTRTFVGGLLTGLLGAVAGVPLLMRVLLPRRTARIRRLLGRVVTPPVTQLRLERSDPEPGPVDGGLGYSVAEMAGVVGGLLRTIGLTGEYARLVVVMGHGSSSLNNPQEAAHDCGACGGARGGPNARAFSQMANDPRVRRLLAEDGLPIPDEVHFVGAYHNTCDDGLTYFDLDRLPASHRGLSERARAASGEARRRNAQERCRRFESAGPLPTADEALRHVEARAEDLSQTRPEYGHATNAACVVGRRSRTRGLFLDRRAFLASYDPTRDDAEGSTLAALLGAVIPVCAGINLEYFFSSVDPSGYGCGTKLPHNITSLLGVMDGAASDLRPGLPWQMVEIHEPMRILFVVETTPEILMAILGGEGPIGRLVRNGWVQLATLDPASPAVHVFRDGGFEPYRPGDADLPVAPSSAAWSRGRRGHLGFATISPEAGDHDPIPEGAAR
ncbi:DUF2309 domain-containing protein [Tautonia plasticadhaerens]|uniref:Probable inorganic carbon transporter subunit DabA n=1 Tax=Tautonia plasticadhaerens TaxID=2527974 RepID=A0A518H0U5_9BACT|nr:DUF2309 domain-containing protein [Tautonia plasticadhaerens]QDV34443.1 hypothetical protein ElP_23320 [Tautonia plasticadhaerens]